MEANTEQSQNTDNSSTNNSTYAGAVSRGIPSSDDNSNNNPSFKSDITNANELVSDAAFPANQDSATLENNKNLLHANPSRSQNESFDDAEDSQLSFKSHTSNNPASDISNLNTSESTVSGATLNSREKTSNVLNMNESSSSAENADSGEESDVEDEGRNLENLYPTALKWKFRPSNPALALPNTVTVLETNHGSKVYLVGTAHFSLESQEDVAKTIQAVCPDIVMLELCKSRVNILTLDEATVLEEAKGLNFQKIKATLEQNGFVQGVLYFLLLSMSVHLTKELGMAPGGEFRRAYTESKKVPGCMVHLGDRLIHITLQRAFAKLSMWQKLRIAWYMLRSKGPITKEEVERCKQKDLLEEMLAEMTGEFPILSEVFVKERDIYLAYSLQIASLPMSSPRSPDVVTPSTVVGVVGIGHVPGIKSNWGKVRDEDIPMLMCIPEPSMSSRVIRQTLRISVYALGAYGVYKLFPRSLIPSKTRITSVFNSWFGTHLNLEL